MTQSHSQSQILHVFTDQVIQALPEVLCHQPEGTKQRPAEVVKAGEAEVWVRTDTLYTDVFSGVFWLAKVTPAADG